VTNFNGPDYSPEFDDERLTAQHIRIRTLMLDGEWRALFEIARATSDPEASVSAQLRHLRKQRFGAYVVEKRTRGERKSGLYEYRLLKREGAVPDTAVRRNRYREALVKLLTHPDTTESQLAIINRALGLGATHDS